MLFLFKTQPLCETKSIAVFIYIKSFKQQGGINKVKRFVLLKRIAAIVLTVLMITSAFSLISTAAVTSSATPDEVTPVKQNAQIIKTAKVKTGANTGYNVNDSSSWKLWWKKDFKYTNAVTGKKETIFANQYINYHTVNKKGSSSKTTVWCIQPYMCIYNDGNYFMTSDGGNKSFINALNKKPNIKNAVAATIAFGKPMGATKNNEYYFAVQLISWEFETGQRNPTTYDKTGESLLNYVKCETSKKTNLLKDAYDYIVHQLKHYKDMPVNKLIFTSISKANKLADEDKINLSPKTDASGYYYRTETIKGLNEFDDLTYTVVNQNDNKTEKDIKVSVSGNKMTVKSKVKLDEDTTSYKYFVRISRDLKVTNSTKDSVLQNKSANSQTVTSGMSFTATPSVRYIPIFHKIPDKGSIFVQKNITSDSDYQGDYSGWYFLYKNTTTGDSKVLETDSNGKTKSVDNIEVGNKVTVTELGRLILSTDNVVDFKDIQTVSGKQYGLPKDFTNKTRTYSKTISSAERVPVDWENEYTKPFPVKIKKYVDDDTDVSDYYFLVYDSNASGMKTPQIVGPTNDDGEIEFNLDKAKSGVLAVVELGYLKPGHTYKENLTYDDVENGSFREHFYIPARYNPQQGVYSITGLADGIPIDISKSNINSGSKEVIVENTTSGMLKIHKQDSVTKKPLSNVVYGIFYYQQSNTDDTDYNNVSDESGSPGSSSSADSGELEGNSDSDGDTDSDTPPNLVTTLTTDSNGDAISKLIPTGKYYVQEISCDDYHALDTKKYDVEIKPGANTELTAIKRNFEDEPSYIIISKKESSSLSSNNTFLSDCQIQIFEKPTSGKLDYNKAVPVFEFTTKNSAENIIGKLKVGHTYIVHEKSCPVGYCLANDIEFTVPTDGTKKSINMSDKTTYVKAIKIDEKTDSYMAGITLQIQDSNNKAVKVKDYDGKLVDSWVTKNTPLVIEGVLEAGKDYKLVELITKPGYTLAEPVPFTVSKSGELQEVRMENLTTKYEFSKRKLTGTDEFPGNKMRLKEKDTNILIEEWVSADKPHLIEGVLEPGKTYVLTERKPYDGYTTAEKIEFTVSNDGQLHSIVMRNSPTKLQVNKLDNKGNQLSGATLQIQDTNGNPIKVKDYDGKLVDSWVTKVTPLTIEGILAINQRYKLVELKSPDGFTVASSIDFVVRDTNELQPITLKNDTTKVEFSKIAGDTKKQLSGCLLSITDSKGNEVKRFTTTNEPYYLEGVLVAGETYTLTEISAREGYMKAQPIKFKVRTDGIKQTVTMTDLKYIRPELPKTGGFGVLPFVVVGVSSFVCASVVYLIKRRLKSK